jgi:Transposase DDE domain group 1
MAAFCCCARSSSAFASPDRLAACMVDPRAPDLITHSLADILRFRLLMIAAGYEDGNDASSLRSDPMFKMALDLSAAGEGGAYPPASLIGKSHTRAAPSAP